VGIGARERFAIRIETRLCDPCGTASLDLTLRKTPVRRFHNIKLDF